MAIAQEAAWGTQGADLLQDTVEQFEKVMDLERTLLRRSIKKLEAELEEASTALDLKEEELVVWGHRIQQIREDNEKKYALARARFDKDKFRGHQRGRAAGVGGGARSLGLIAEVDEVSTIMERDEEDEEDDIVRDDSTAEVAPTNTPVQLESVPPRESQPDEVPNPMVEDINALADIVAEHMTALQKQWQDLNADVDKLESRASDLRSSQASLPSYSGISEANPSTPLFNDALYARLTVGERIDRLQRDIRNETDRILMERGATQSNCGTPKATLSATAVGFANPGNDQRFPLAGNLAIPSVGSLEVPHVQGSSVSCAGSQRGLHTPQSMSSRMGNIPYNGSVGFVGGSSLMMRSATNEQSQESVGTGSRPTHVMNMRPGSMSVGVGFQAVGSVARCVSPTSNTQTHKAYPGQAPQEQQRSTNEARSRPPQYLPANRPLSGLSPTPASRIADPLQASIGSQAAVASSGGPPRWTMGPTQVPLGSSPPQPVGLGSSPPQPVSSVTAGRRASFNNGRH